MKADQAQPVLVEDEMDDRCSFRPVFVCLSDIRIGLHLGQYLIRYRTYNGWVRAHDAESNREWRIGAEDKLYCPYTGFGREACRYLLAEM